MSFPTLPQFPETVFDKNPHKKNDIQTRLDVYNAWEKRFQIFFLMVFFIVTLPWLFGFVSPEFGKRFTQYPHFLLDLAARWTRMPYMLLENALISLMTFMLITPYVMQHQKAKLLKLLSAPRESFLDVLSLLGSQVDLDLKEDFSTITQHKDPTYEALLNRLENSLEDGDGDDLIDHISRSVFRYPTKLTYLRNDGTKTSTTVDLLTAAAWLKVNRGQLSIRTGEMIDTDRVMSFEFDQNIIRQIHAKIRETFIVSSPISIPAFIPAPGSTTALIIHTEHAEGLRRRRRANPLLYPFGHP